jgi:hypothetical protein
MVRTITAVAAFSLLLTSCGYVGDPLPPALNIPTKVTDLSAVQRADKIFIDFTIPPLTTEGLVLKRLGPPDLQIGDKPVDVIVDKTGPVHLEVPAKDWIGQNAAVRVRINNGRGRYSDWSNTVDLAVVAPLEAPGGITAKSDPHGVRLSWQNPSPREGETWRVLRLSDKKTAVVDHPEYLDTETEYGKEYQYQVVAVLKTAESEPSAVASITPKDEFPPAVPVGLTALAGINTIELAWDRVTDEDLKGYRIYRALEAGPFERIAELVEEPAYSDKAITAGKKYRYAVSSIDQTGNESAKSAPIEINAPQ